MSVHPSKLLSEFLTWTSGPTGGDSRNLNPVASLGSPSVFELRAAVNETLVISRVHFLIRDSQSAAGKFGGIAGGLTNGLKIESINQDGSTIDKDFLDSLTIKVNEHFDWLAGIDVPGIDDSKTVGIVPVRWTLSKDSGGPTVALHEGAALRVTVQDDLSPLTEFRIMVKGLKP